MAWQDRVDGTLSGKLVRMWSTSRWWRWRNVRKRIFRWVPNQKRFHIISAKNKTYLLAFVDPVAVLFVDPVADASLSYGTVEDVGLFDCIDASRSLCMMISHLLELLWLFKADLFLKRESHFLHTKFRPSQWFNNRWAFRSAHVV